MLRIHLLFLYCFYMLLFVTLSAQTGKLYSTDKELSNSLINSIYQDKRNYLWVATEDGLNKYDAVKFTIYKNKSGDSTSLKNNYVRVMFEDSNNRFWVGCVNGLLSYDRAKDSFSEIKLYKNEVRIEPHITSISESKNADVWIATSGEGVIRVKNGSNQVQIDEDFSAQLNSRFLTSILIDKNENVWIGNETEGVNYYSTTKRTMMSFKAPNGIGSNQISSICEDKQGEIFVGTLTGGLYRYNKSTQIFESIPYLKSLTPLPVKSIFCNNQNQLLVGTDGKGMKILNRKAQILDDFQIPSAPFDFSKMKVHAILQDKAGNLWTGLFQKGVYLSPNKTNRFNYYGNKSFLNNVIGSSCIMALSKDLDNTLWVGTDNDGLYAIDASGKSTHYPPQNGPNAISSTILCILDDGNGKLWLGSFLDGLICFDKRTAKSKSYNNRHDSLQNNTSSNRITSLAKDAKNQLWIGSNGGGLYVFDLNTKQYIKHYSSERSGNYRIENNWINTIICGDDGVVWCGSAGGVFSINPITNNIKYYNVENKVLPGNIVFSLLEDETGNIWIGTTEGLACFDKKTQKSKIYRMKDGLPSNVICSIQNDEKGNIWLSSHMGISKFIVNENLFVNYFNFDGLQGNEFSMGAGCKDAKGQLFFGGVNGISYFYPNQINNERTPLKIHLTGLNIKDKPVNLGQMSGGKLIIDTIVSDIKTIYLDYKDNVFSLEFSTFEFGKGERVFYRYKMDGISDEWLTTEEGVNKISFSNLSYGSHKLLVYASAFGSKSDERIIYIVISPPWYLTWWAKIIYFLLFILAIWFGVKYALDQIKHRHEIIRREHVEQINEAKLQFFINVSHEIRTPMTLIISPLAKLISETVDVEKRKVFQMMYRNSQRILRLINQSLDVRKIDKGLLSVKYNETNMVDFIDDIMQTFEYLANSKSIKFEFFHEKVPVMAWVDQNNFDKILINLLSNAFKFTPENGEISITLRTGTDHSANNELKEFFEVIVSDSGIGIDKSEIDKIFERYYQIENGQTKMNLGTGIGLHLSRSLVELQHGTIKAQNKADGKGSEFVVRLPLGNSHIATNEIRTTQYTQKDANRIDTSAVPIFDYETNKVPLTNAKSKTNIRILIVDDEDDIREYIKSELSDMYKISECVNGKDALDFILKNKPDLVISDVMMPEMDGVSLCKRMKSNINVKHIPIILLTAKTTDDDKAVGYEMGADAYIPKPFNVELLKKRVANLIANRELLKARIAEKEENKDLIQAVVLKSSDQILLEKVIKVINENIDNSDLNVDLLARNVGMSRAHMHRKLKELTNMSARDYIRSIRMKQAADLLTGKKLTISEVAYALGFVTLSHFSNSFREFYGTSPTDFIQGQSSNKV